MYNDFYIAKSSRILSINSPTGNGTAANNYTYNSSKQISSIAHNGFNYNFSYNNFNNQTAVAVSGNTLVTNSCEANNGNITGYTYGNGDLYYYDDSSWKDKLTRFNNDSITYDEIGNPVSYRNGMNMTWENGRQLKQLAVNDDVTVDYEYNADGLRTGKRINGNSKYFNYYYDANNNLTALSDKNGKVMQFYYDSKSNLSSVRYDGIMYYYIKNLQGDITKLIKADGTVAANYIYDQWGYIISVTDANGEEITSDAHIANINPFRYRGYVYDNESGFYYLQSRYYDPVVKRFINADIFCDTQTGVLGTNMFAYCINNPVNSADSNGEVTYVIIPGVLYRYCDYYSWNIRDGYFYYGQYAPQWWAGYGNVYDHLSGYAFMNLRWLKACFNYGGKEWMIEIWKGIYGTLSNYGLPYGLFKGAEIGVYNRPGDWKSYRNSNNFGRRAQYWWYYNSMYNCASRGDFLDMTLALYDRNNFIFRRRETTWWLTGFKYSPNNGNPNSLKVQVSIRFKTKTMRDRCYWALTQSGASFYVRPRVGSDSKRGLYIVTFTW